MSTQALYDQIFSIVDPLMSIGILGSRKFFEPKHFCLADPTWVHQAFGARMEFPAANLIQQGELPRCESVSQNVIRGVVDDRRHILYNIRQCISFYQYNVGITGLFYKSWSFCMRQKFMCFQIRHESSAFSVRQKFIRVF